MVGILKCREDRIESVIKQDAQLSQRDRAAVRYSFRQK